MPHQLEIIGSCLSRAHKWKMNTCTWTDGHNGSHTPNVHHSEGAMAGIHISNELWGQGATKSFQPHENRMLYLLRGEDVKLMVGVEPGVFCWV